MGHPPSDVWQYTPRQITGYLHFALRRKRFADADVLSLGTLAARGESKDVKSRHEDLIWDG